jgi:hypothetical protein
LTWEENKCKSIIWRENRDLVYDLELEREIDIDICSNRSNYLTLKASAIVECPTPYFGVTLDPKLYEVENGYGCSDVQQLDTGLFENLTIESYYRSFGGNASLEMRFGEHPENITYYDAACKLNPCGVYRELNKTMESTPLSFSVCANTTDSEVSFRNIVTTWKFFTYHEETVVDTEYIQVVGRPEINLIKPSRFPVLEGQRYNMTVRVESLCGYSEVTVNGNTDNETKAYFDPDKDYRLTLNNREQGYVLMPFQTNYTGKVNFTIDATVSNMIYGDYYYIEIEEDPTRCPGNYTYCDEECKLNPKNCTQDCATGGTFCYDDEVFCEVSTCGGTCPFDEERFCDAAGECKILGRQGWGCNCEAICSPSYRQGDTCYYSSSCNEGMCTYLYQECIENATCLPSGCCGDDVCDATETCLTCAADCGCDDGNPCTDDICTGICTNKPKICGYPCPDGGCDGEGNCLSDICCRNEDCTLNPCQEGVCVNYQCQLVNYSCVPCPGGFCYEGNCYYSLGVGELCPCQNACNGTMTCYEGKCSTCGNGMCEVGECAICPDDCPPGFCPKGSFLVNILVIASVGIAVIGLLAYFKVI